MDLSFPLPPLRVHHSPQLLLETLITLFLLVLLFLLHYPFLDKILLHLPQILQTPQLHKRFHEYPALGS